jgi:hypothetical protein
MALRTFHFNPSLGGFGGESSPLFSGDAAATSDAFCQIIKELVDNAVDACIPRAESSNTGKNQSRSQQMENRSNGTSNKRVRVVIERFHGQSKDYDEVDCMNYQANCNKSFIDEENVDDDTEILRVTVSDNGCGMFDIQKCVSAFQTSKAHASLIERSYENSKEKEGKKTVCPKKKKQKKATSKANNTPSDATSATSVYEGKTAGRYGIGLTLCLLHAQRLVPNSCASIRSATIEQNNWTNVLCVVDSARDSVHCVFQSDHDSVTDNNPNPHKKHKNETPQEKSFPTESGTAISILIPVSKKFTSC